MNATKPPAQPLAVRRHNTAAVLQQVLTSGPLSRAEVAARLGLSQATVSRIVGPVVSAGVLMEQRPQAGGGGRPRVPLAVDPTARLAVGLHLGMQRTTVGLVDLAGTVRSVAVRTRRPARPETLIAQAARIIEKLVADTDAPVLGIGATTGGWVDSEPGTVVTNEALGWRDVRLRELLGQRLELPVLVESSVRAQAGAELWFGCAQQATSTVQLFVGNVVDAAFTVDRRVHRGMRSAAGRIEHLSLPGGCLHDSATDKAVLTVARRRGVIGEADGLSELVDRARARDQEADAVLRERARLVGHAVTMLVDLLDPDLVVLAGGVLAVPEHLTAVREALLEQPRPGWDPRQVVATGLGADLLVSSSAAVVLGAYVADPLRFESFA
ncbi:MAG: ROK family protein [Sciscionella sp.]